MPIDYERIRSKMGDTSVTNLSSISLCDIDIISFHLRDTESWMCGWYEEGIGSVCVRRRGGGVLGGTRMIDLYLVKCNIMT